MFRLDADRADAGMFDVVGQLADLPLPGTEEVESLIRREGGLRAFQLAPDAFRGGEVVNDVDAGDAARLRPRI